MKKSCCCLIVLFLVSILFWSTSSLVANAENQDFNLEAERNWDTYRVGGTCIYGTQKIFVGDIDNDETMEILKGGFAYNTENGSRTASQAPLKIWS